MAQGADTGGGGVVVSDAFNYHQIRNISRAEGRSAVKAAAYITGDSMHDARVGLTFGRAESAGRVLASETIGPKGTTWTAGDLWSAAEKSETRKNSRTAQEHIVALPHQLDEAAHRRLLRGFALWHRDTYGTAGTWALHAPNAQGDQRNVHAHLLFTTRRVEAGADGVPVFGAKVREIHGATGPQEVERARAEWGRRVNAELARAGLVERMDHRSHKRRAEEDGTPPRTPTAHKGPRVVAQERRRARASGRPQPIRPAPQERRAAGPALHFEDGAGDWADLGDMRPTPTARPAASPPVPTALNGKSGPGGDAAPQPRAPSLLADSLEERRRAAAERRAIRDQTRANDRRETETEREAAAQARHLEREERAAAAWREREAREWAAWKRRQRGGPER